MRLSFGFVVETVLISQTCFITLLHSVKAFTVPYPTPPARRLRVHKELEGKTSRLLNATDPKDIPDHMVSCRAYRAGAGTNKQEMFLVIVFVFPSHHHIWWKPAFLGMDELFPTHRR